MKIINVNAVSLLNAFQRDKKDRLFFKSLDERGRFSIFHAIE